MCLYVSKATDLVADLQGYAPASSSFVATVPERVLETRTDLGQVSYCGAKPMAGQTIEVKVTGFGATKVPADAGAVLLNVTSAARRRARLRHGLPVRLAAAAGVEPQPTVLDTPTLVVAKIGEGGRVCIYTSVDTHLVADIAGYFPDTAIVGS